MMVVQNCNFEYRCTNGLIQELHYFHSRNLEMIVINQKSTFMISIYLVKQVEQLDISIGNSNNGMDQRQKIQCGISWMEVIIQNPHK